MRLALVVNGFPILSETFIFNKVMGLRDAGVDVTVHANSRKNDFADFAARLADRRPGLTEYSVFAGGRARMPLSLTRLVARYPGPAARLWSQAQTVYGRTRRALHAYSLALPLATRHYDIIHFEYSGLAVSYLDALPLLKSARLVVSCRGSAEQITPLVRPERSAKLAALFKLADRVHCVSADMVRTVTQYGLQPRRAFVNHPAIDSARFARRRPYPAKLSGPYCLVSTGRLHWTKGFEYSLLAVRQLLDAGYDVHYDIIGGGAGEEALQFAIHDLGMANRVRLRGRQPAETVRELLEAADVYLQPSLSEGLSNATLEAMAMGVPVIATTVGGMDEAITDGCEGFLVPPRTPEALAARVGAVLDCPDLRVTMGRAGRGRVENHFTLERQIACFVQEYRMLKTGNRCDAEIRPTDQRWQAALADTYDFSD